MPKHAAGLRLALIEDNDDLRDELLFFLRHRGYSTWGVNSAEAFWKQLHRDPVDIVLIDIGLPGEDGFGVVDYLHRLGGYGLVILSADGREQQRLRGMNLGADLYLVKPVNFARLGDALQDLGLRVRGPDAAAVPAPVSALEPGQWQLDILQGCLLGASGAGLPLSRQELALLKILLHSANQIFSKEALHDLLFEHACERELHRVDVILSRLRRKAKENSFLLPIRTVFGKGVVFTGHCVIAPAAVD